MPEPSAGSSDPGHHQARESEAIDHVARLLADGRFVVDTVHGQRPVTKLKQQTNATDRSVDLKKTMAQHRPDRELEQRMPVGRTLTTSFTMNRWYIFQQVVGRLIATAYSPVKTLLADESPKPMTAGETRRAISALPPPLAKVPTTVILISTSGFDPDARELANRTSEANVILMEPTAAGGWTINGSTEIHGLLDLMDPEPEARKHGRVAKKIEDLTDEMVEGSLSAEKLAVETELPLMTVEAAVKSYAKQRPGLVAKRFDGRLLLYREGSAPQGKAVGGEGMSLTDRIKVLLSRKGDHEKKIAYLSERRTALVAQRDASHDELFKLEKKESTLKREFKENDSPTARRRVTTQLVQLKKEIERRHQLLQVVNQQVNVVGTHLHNLELLRQGKNANLPDTDEIANDAAAAEEMLATLQADSELAESVSSISVAGLSGEEQEMYDELLADAEKSSPSSAAVKKSALPYTPVTEPELPASPDSNQSPRTPEREPG
ncbi:MAG: hypothetical protein JWM57_1645 [Phycisphaerales bacterium]|nr:hypothetical protein [Phycisphaerales bacterium]